jgi:hypothetical protein
VRGRALIPGDEESLGGCGLDFLQVGGAQLEGGHPGQLSRLPLVPDPDDRARDAGLMEHPGEGPLRRATAAALAERGSDRRELELGERVRAAEVVRIEDAGVEPVSEEAGG